MTEQEMKDWIDSASYEELLRKNRFAPLGDPCFMDEMGEYYLEKMREKRSAISPDEAVRVSKRIES